MVVRKELLITFLIVVIIRSSFCQQTIQTFSLADVELSSDTDYALGASLNHEYLLLLDPYNLLYNFRTTADLPNPIGSHSYGGWEGPTVEVRGQFLGHYLSALAFAFKSTGNPTFLNRSTLILDSLAECQAAHGTGYLSAFPSEHFDRLESLQPVWAPYYVIHKIMQGILDQHQLSKQPKALPMLTSMASYFCSRVKKVINTRGYDHWQHILETEFGGMNEVLYKLYQETQEEQWLQCGDAFTKDSWYVPLSQGVDALAGLHANTHLAQVNGYAARFEALNSVDDAFAVVHFFRSIVSGHSFSSGGSNRYEHWGVPASLGSVINESGAAANTQESCTTYNILKIARSLFRFSGNPVYVDFYERAILNGVLGIQRHGHAHAHHQDSHGDRSTYKSTFKHYGKDHHLFPTDFSEDRSEFFDMAMQPAPPEEDERLLITATNALHEQHTRPLDYRVVSWPDDPAQHILARRHSHATTNTMSRIVSSSGKNGPGQYIYYLPLGHEGGKGDNAKAWTQGWGDRFNTFWCCYGTAVESFSKFADSIYFWRGGNESRGFGESISADSEPVSEKKEIVQNRSNKGIPHLYVNQLVSSTLHWKRYGIRLVQVSDLYAGDNHAHTTLRIESVSQPQHAVDAPLNFYLHWRLPSWFNDTIDTDDAIALERCDEKIPSVALRCFTLNDEPLSCDSITHRNESWSDSGNGLNLQLNPPNFGSGSAYLVLGPRWQHGDTLRVRMPFSIRTEDINDNAREDAATLKAVIMGPFHMVGLTEGDRTLDGVDAKNIQDAVSDLPLDIEKKLMSLEHEGKVLSVASRHPGSQTGTSIALERKYDVRSISSGGGRNSRGKNKHCHDSSRYENMKITFKITDPLFGCETASDSGATSVRLEKDGGRMKTAHHLFCSRAAYDLAVVGHGKSDYSLVSIESMVYPGHYIASSSGNTSDGRTMLRLLQNNGIDGLMDDQRLMMTFVVSRDGGMIPLVEFVDAAVKEKSMQPPAVTMLLPPCAKEYPKGARLLSGKASKYVIVPLGQVIDEHYTAYFEFIK